MVSEDPLVVSISSSTSLNPDDIPKRSFPAARKGIDGEAVRRYLETLADDVRGLLEREAQLRRRAVEAERKAAEPPVLDEATLNRAVGAETARVLQSAHDAAREVIARAEARASTLLAEAEEQATERTDAAERESRMLLDAAVEDASAAVAGAQADTAVLRDDAAAEAEAIVEAAKDDAVALLDSTKKRCRETVRDARKLRMSVLSDLVERRRALYVQLEQLRSGRDSLLAVVAAVETTVEELKARLTGAEHDARVAAAEAGELAETLVDAEVGSLLEPDVAFELHSELLGTMLGPDADEELDSVEGTGPGAADAGPLSDLAAEELEGGEESEQSLEEVQAEDTADSRRSVGELFARIRAAGDTGSDEEGPAEPEEGPVSGPAEEGLEALPRADGGDAGVGASDAATRARRDALLAPVLSKLSRALKRALQDDQNELLNAMRRASGTADLDSLLPKDLQSERYVLASSGLLSEGWMVGRGWLRQAGESSPGGDDVDIEAVASDVGRQLGIDLASELSSMLRHRISESLQDIGDVGDGANDAAGTAYREWKGPRIEGIAGDFATRAFAAGAVAAGAGTAVRWVVDDGRPCPDCDDNALAGEQPAGSEWPTGQVHPPVHPGCRCLLAATAVAE